MKKIKGLLFAALAFVLVACGNGTSGENGGNNSEEGETAGASTSEKTELIVGIDDTFAPMSFKDENGDIVGFDVDLAEAAGEIMGVDFVFQPIDWSLKETELNTGKIDLIWNGYSITPEREEKVLFSEPYMENSQIIVTLAGSDIETKADLAGKVVATQAQSASLDAIAADPSGIGDEFDGGEAVQYPTFTDVFNDLESGRADAIVVDEILGRYIMSQKGPENYKVLEEDFGDEEFGVGMRQEDTQLKEDLDAAIEETRQNGKFEEIYNKWFN